MAKLHIYIILTNSINANLQINAKRLQNNTYKRGKTSKHSSKKTVRNHFDTTSQIF